MLVKDKVLQRHLVGVHSLLDAKLGDDDLRWTR